MKNFSTPILNQYSRDLTALAKQGKLDPVIGREEEIVRVIRILSRRTKNNAILVGEAGVGKTVIAEALAQAIIEGKVPQVLKSKRILALNLGAMLAGTQYRGEFERRIEAATREIRRAQRSIIIFIDEIQILTQAGEAMGAIGAANLLKPMLARGELQVVGAATPDDYEKYIQEDRSLERRFQLILIKEPLAPETIRILEGLREKYEEYHQVKIPAKIIKAAVELTDKYLPDRHFPDKAIDLIDEAAAQARLSVVRGVRKTPKLSTEDLEKILFQWSQDIVSLKRAKELK